ncbi:MAG: hypothetical protein K6G80_07120 [Treponema sp.]|nr:hypothetical protein [Treponema sp.]
MTDAVSVKAACERTMNRFLELDKGERLPLAVTLHLLWCRDCRTQVRLMTMAERVVSGRSVHKMSLQKPVSLKKWIFGGVCMILFMLVFGRAADYFASEALWTAFALVFAAAVTAYCAIFVGCNMDFFVKKIGMEK